MFDVSNQLMTSIGLIAPFNAIISVIMLVLGVVILIFALKTWKGLLQIESIAGLGQIPAAPAQ